MSKATELLKILPDAIFIECAAIAWDTRKYSFRIGQIANQIKEQLVSLGRLSDQPEPGERFSIMDVYETVSILLNHEFSSRTVRDFARIAALFPPDVQQEYDVLPFSHFRFSAQLPKPLEGLQISMAEMGRRNGTPPPVSWLEHWFYGNTQPPMPPAFEPEISQMAYRSNDLIGGQLSGGVSLVAAHPRLRQITESFETELDRLALPEIVYSAVLSLWKQIVSILDGYRT